LSESTARRCDWRPSLAHRSQRRSPARRRIMACRGHLQTPALRGSPLVRIEAHHAYTALPPERRTPAGGERITLLCSSSCPRARRCHRSLLRALIEKQIPAIEADPTRRNA
jgi:hypothetical protein